MLGDLVLIKQEEEKLGFKCRNNLCWKPVYLSFEEFSELDEMWNCDICEGALHVNTTETQEIQEIIEESKTPKNESAGAKIFVQRAK